MEEGYTTEGTPFLYQDDYLDPATELYHMQARWYDPQAALFTSPDPAMGDATDPTLRYPYAYCAGDPVYNADPSGERLVEGEGEGGRMITWAPTSYLEKYTARRGMRLSDYYRKKTLERKINYNLMRARAKSTDSSRTADATRHERQYPHNGTTSRVMSSGSFGVEGFVGLFSLFQVDKYEKQGEIVGPQDTVRPTRWDRWVLFKIPGYKAHRRGEYFQDVIAYEIYYSSDPHVREDLAIMMQLQTGNVYDPQNPEEVFRGATQDDYRMAVKATQEYRLCIPYLAARTMGETTEYIPKLSPGVKNAARIFAEAMVSEKLDKWLEGSGF